MISSAIWAVVTLYFLWRAEKLGKEWLDKQKPLYQIQYDELSRKLEDIQSQVNSISIQRDIE